MAAEARPGRVSIQVPGVPARHPSWPLSKRQGQMTPRRQQPGQGEAGASPAHPAGPHTPCRWSTRPEVRRGNRVFEVASVAPAPGGSRLCCPRVGFLGSRRPRTTAEWLRTAGTDSRSPGGHLSEILVWLPEAPGHLPCLLPLRWPQCPSARGCLAVAWVLPDPLSLGPVSLCLVRTPGVDAGPTRGPRMLSSSHDPSLHPRRRLIPNWVRGAGRWGVGWCFGGTLVKPLQHPFPARTCCPLLSLPGPTTVPTLGCAACV